VADALAHVVEGSDALLAHKGSYLFVVSSGGFVGRRRHVVQHDDAYRRIGQMLHTNAGELPGDGRRVVVGQQFVGTHGDDLARNDMTQIGLARQDSLCESESHVSSPSLQ
jgi:hypothetical protein